MKNAQEDGDEHARQRFPLVEEIGRLDPEDTIKYDERRQPEQKFMRLLSDDFFLAKPDKVVFRWYI